jgi:hypothetical protein
LKLEALRIEAQSREADLVPAVIIVDTAPEEIERMGSWTLTEVRDAASSRGVCFFYLSPEDEFFDNPEGFGPPQRDLASGQDHRHLPASDE